MNVIRTTAFIAAAAAVTVAASVAFGANPVYYAPYSPAPTYVASPYGYTTYCTQNGCYQVPVSNPGVQSYGYPASGYPARGYSVGSPCANGACAISPMYGAPRAAPVYQTMPAPAYRTAPTAPSNYPFNSGSGGYYTVPSTSPVYTAPQPSPYYLSPGATNPVNGTATGNKVSAPVVKAPSQNIALNNLPSPFYP